MSNLFNYEHHVRLVMGMAMLLYAGIAASWLMGAMAVILIYTGAMRFCPVFYSLGINRDLSQRRYHLSLLPGNNPEPVYLFNKAGDLVFRNDAATNILPHLGSLEDLQKQDDFTSFGQGDEHVIEGFHDGDRRYLLHYKPLDGSDLIAAYGFNVTDLLQANDEVINTQKELVYRMGEIGETRSKETGNHVKRVAEYSKQLALLAGLSPDKAELLKMASPMHDIGKVAIPDSVLNKPGKLDPDEWEIMKTHASIGYDLLCHSDRPILQAAAIVAGQHHEKWDGTGYPGGFSGEEIHIYGRITALADVFDALASERVYKKAWPLKKVLDLIREQRGRHFDPNLVDLLLSNLDRFLVIREQYQDQNAQEQAA
jgi:HD-GYP domain-containing protein (c-di-GMP phosphodiesterase class II)